MVWNLFPLKGDFSFGKSQKSQVTKSVLQGGIESPGWLDVSPKISARHVMHEQACCHDEPANHQLPIAAAFWILWIVSRRIFKLNAKGNADLLLYSLSHFECNGRTVHMLTQWRLPPPPTSKVKLPLFTHAHSSPLSLAVRLHQCGTNCSCYLNNGWTFYGQTSLPTWMFTRAGFVMANNWKQSKCPLIEGRLNTFYYFYKGMLSSLLKKWCSLILMDMEKYLTYSTEWQRKV